METEKINGSLTMQKKDISGKQLNKYRDECVRVFSGEITKMWEVARMNSRDFPDGNYRMSFPTKREALNWIKKNGWKLWGYWENAE